MESSFMLVGRIFIVRINHSRLLIIDSEPIYNEKLLKLAFNMSELTFLQAKQQLIEEHLQTARQRNESHAVIEVCFSSKRKFYYHCLLYSISPMNLLLFKQK